MFQNIKSVFIKIDKNLLLSVVAVSAVLGTAAMIFVPFSDTSIKGIAESSIDYLNQNILTQGGQTASLVSFSKESGVIKVKMKIGDQEYDSYVTADGKLFFPEAISLAGATPTENTQAQNPAPPQPQTPANLTKVDNTMLEAYVVSMCPFGLQMQRMMDNAIANVPALASHLKVRYMGSIVNGAITAMHGDKEAQENLRQICIREEQTAKYWPYVSCYMREGNGTSCQTSEKVDVAKLNACVSDKNRGLKYAQADFDLEKKYAVKGSPTLILNGAPVSEFDFGGRNTNAIKDIICGSSTTPSEFCGQKLNTEQAATSFSVTYAGAGSSANNAANCAPR